MDKYTKTTEIDISAMNVIEEDPPKKSKLGKVVAIVISLLLAVAIWLYVVETDATMMEDEVENIEVQIINPKKFDVAVKPVTVVLKGTTSDLVDIKKEDVLVTLDLSQLSEVGEHYVELSVQVNSENVTAEIKENKKVLVKVTE